MAEPNYTPKFDFTGVDFLKVDPEKVSLGTNIQDCAVIANAFERGAHSVPTEAALFATFTRTIANRKLVATAAVASLSGFLQAPELSSVDSSNSSATNSASADGALAVTQENIQSLNLGGTYNTTLSAGMFGKTLMDQLKNCIPCQLRLLSFLELHPNFDLLKAYKDWYNDCLKLFKDLADLLNNIDTYADLCNLMKALSFMCIPDLQRIIVALMAQFILMASALDGMIGLLQALLAPLFAPILQAVTALLDMLKQLVTGPLVCVLDMINQTIRMTGGGSVIYTQARTGNATTDKMNTGLVQLSTQLNTSIVLINTKLALYTGQIKVMMGEMGAGDAAYMSGKMQMLQLIRLIAFVTAIITALIKGHIACNPMETPAAEELENFFNNFLNPNSSFNISVDPNGSLRVDEKVPDWNLPDSGNVIQFEGEPLLPGDTGATVSTIANALATPVKALTLCRLETTSDEVAKVNSWITELNKS